MTPETQSPTAPVEEVPVFSLDILPHLTPNFEKADAELKRDFGASPGVPALMRLALACWTSARIRREFERAILDIRRKSITPPEEGEFDEDCI